MDQGNYKGNLIAAVAGQAATGTLQMELNFDITNGGQPTGVIVKVFLFLSTDAMAYTMEKLNRMGFDGDFVSPSFTVTTDIGLEMKEESYNGKATEKWSLLRSAAPASPDVLRILGAKYKALYASTLPKPAGKPPLPPSATPKPAPPAAAPAATPPPPASPPAKPYDKVRAWDELQLRPNFDVTKWHEAIAFVGAGREEADFLPADWEKVATFEIPF